MIRLVSTLFIFTFYFFNVNAQTNNKGHVGVELQQYPTGYLLGVYGEFGLTQKDYMTLRIAYNGLDHKDFGVQDEEKGGGPGGSIGYFRYLNNNHKGFHFGARLDAWYNSVDWKTEIGPALLTGNTKVFVLQPTGILAYTLNLGSNWVIIPTLAFGVEINASTDGEPVGEGAIGLWGLNFGRRF